MATTLRDKLRSQQGANNTTTVAPQSTGVNYSTKTQSTSPALPSLGEFYANTINKMKNDPANRATYELALNTVTTDPTSPYYNPYTQATINSTGKTYSRRVEDGYAQLNALYSELSYWVNRTDKGYTDDEIIDKINMNNYDVLKKMDEGRASGRPYELNAPVPYAGKDTMKGMLWSIRNGGQTSGDYAVDSAMNYMGRGNVSPESRYAHMADATLETYAPYKAGRSVTTDKYAYQFGATADFDDSWLLAHDYLKNTEEGSKIYYDIYTANENTKKYEASVAAFNKFAESQIKVGADPSQFLNPDNLALQDWGKDILKLVEGQNSGKLVETTRPLDFDWGDVQRRAQEAFEREESKVSAEKFEEDVATALKADEPVKKPDNFFKNTAKKTRDWVVGLFADEATEEETVALKADDGSFDDVKESVTHSVETSHATTDDMYDIAVSDADKYAAQNLLPSMNRVRELRETIKAIESYQAYYDKWMPRFEADPLGSDIYNDPEYINETYDIQKAMEIYDQYGGDVTALEEELKEQMELQRDVMNRYREAGLYGVDKSGDTLLPVISVIDQFSGFTDESYETPSYQWQDELASGKKTWDEVSTELTAASNQYDSTVRNIDTAIMIAEEAGVSEEYLEGLRATKRAILKEKDAISTAKLRENADFSEKIAEFDKTVKADGITLGNHLKAYGSGVKWAFGLSGTRDLRNLESFAAVPRETYIKNRIIKGDGLLAVSPEGTENDDLIAQLRQLTEDERNTYKYLYMTEGQEKATSYIDALIPALNARGYESAKEKMSVEGDGLVAGAGKNLLAVVGNTLSIFDFVRNAEMSAKGIEVDPTAPTNWMTAGVSSTRSSSKEAIDSNEFLQSHPLLKAVSSIGYDAATTAADSYAAAMTGGGLFMMAGSAAQNSLIDVKLRGGSDTQAFLYAGCMAAVETATEYLPLDNLFDTYKRAGAMGVKDLLGQIAIGTFTDAPGEMMSEWLGGIADDVIMQELSATEYRIAQLMEENKLTRAEAEKQAQKESASNILYAGLLSVASTAGSETAAFATGNAVNAVNKVAENVSVRKEAAKIAGVDLTPRVLLPFSNAISAMDKAFTSKAKKEEASAKAMERASVANKLASGQYVMDRDGNVVPKYSQRELDNQERSIAMLKSVESEDSNTTQQAAAVSSVLESAFGFDKNVADALSKPFVAQYSSNAVKVVENMVKASMDTGNPLTAADVQAYIVDAVVRPDGMEGQSISKGFVGNGLSTRYQEAARFVSPETMKAFVSKQMVASETVKALQMMDSSSFENVRKSLADRRNVVAEKQRAFDKATKAVAEAEAALESAKNEMRANPTKVDPKAVINAKKKVDDAISARKEAANAVEDANAAYKEASEEYKAVSQNLLVAARQQATETVNQYMTEKAVAEEAAALQAEADALAQQESDNLSEMEFQSYVEETAPDATPEQVEEMRQEFGEQREAVEQIRTEQVAKEEANGNVQTPEQKQEAKAIENAKAIGKRFKTNVKTMALPSNINGWFNRDENELVLNSNLSQEQMLEETVVHEFSHKAEDGGRAYDSYSQALLDLVYGGDRKKIKAEIQKVKGKRNKELAQMSQTGGEETYGKDLRFIDDDGARKELVAQATKELLKGDPNLIDSFVNADIDAAYSFFDRLKFVLKRMVGIKGTYAEQLKHTTYLFQKALAKAAENGAKTTKQRVAESKHPASVQFSIDQWAKATGFKFERSPDNKSGYVILDQDGNKIDKVTKEMMDNTPAGKLVDLSVENGTMVAEEASSAKQFLADVMNMVVEFEDQEVVWETVASVMMSSIKKNADKQYGLTVDYGTICSKTRDIINVMSEAMVEKGRGLTREEVIIAYNKTFGEGMSVPCPPCYVFARWMGVPSLLETMRKGQERFANATDDDVNAYIDEVKERYAPALAKAKPKKNGKAKTLSDIMTSRKGSIIKKLDKIREKLAKGGFKEAEVEKMSKQYKELEAELEDIELYNWVTQVLCETGSDNKPIFDAETGRVRIDPEYKAVDPKVLLDMRRTGEFADQYPKAWKFRTTRGAGMGKAQLPYAGAEIGDVLTGANRWKADENPLYTGDDKKALTAIKNAVRRTKAQNLIGGNRFQSTSDFRPEWGLDYLMTFFEMQAIGAKGQLYTKVIEAVDLFASAGIEVNLSVMAKGDGWHLDENGNPVITLEDFSSVTGIDAEQAMQKAQEYDNVQLILVGMNNTHIELALADDRITYVIPWHSSGNSKKVLGQLMEAVGESRGKAQNYEEFQTDKIGKQTTAQKNAWDMRKKILTGGFFVDGQHVEPSEKEWPVIVGNDYLLDLYNKFYVDSTSEAYHVKLNESQASQIFPHEYWDTNSTYDTADVNGKRFVEYCESMGIKPRFPQFADKKGYWKLLIDRPMYSKSGEKKYRPAGYISTAGVFNKNAEADSTAEKFRLATEVSQAKPGTNEQIQNAKQKLIDEIDARTAEQHKFDLSAEHAAPAPAIPANVQFSLRDDSSSDWDVDASVEDNIANTARAKELDEEISRLQAEYKAAEKKYNKATKGMSVERFRELRASGDPIITEFTKAQEAYESAKSKREWLVRNVPKDVRDAAKKYLGLKKRYDQTMEYYKAKPQSSLREEAENIAKDMAVAKREYEELLNPYLEKRQKNEAKRIESDVANAPQMPVETEAVEEQTVEQPVETVSEQPVAEESVIEEAPVPGEPSGEPSGIYADSKAGDDSDYGAEDEPVKPTNEFTYGTLDPAFKIPEAPKGKRVHDTSRKIVADESLPDAVRMEEAKPENSQYEQDSNEAQHNRAAEIIRRRGIDNEYERLMKLESASSPDDIAEILILEQIYNREGTRDMEKLLGVTKKKRQLSAVAATILQSTKSEIAKMSPTELVSRFLGESEDSLENFIKDRPKAAEKIKERADAKTEALSAAVAGKNLDEVSEDNKWYTPLNEAQMAVIKEYGLENVERAGIFYNRATVKQRMLEAIIQTKDPFAMTGMGMNLIERLEYIRSGAQAITIADLNYIQRNLGEFSFFDGLQGGRVSDLALNRALEAYGNTKTASSFEKYRSMRYINMLTSFTSALKNIIGNAGGVAFLDVSHEVENVVDLGISLITGKRTKQSLTVQERLAGWKAFKDESVNTFRDYFVDKVDTNPKNDPFNKHRKGRVYQGKVGEGARNLQGFLMSFGDRNFWKRAYVNSLSEQQKLLDKGLLLNEDGSVPTMDQMIERAKYEADYAVLSEDNFVSKTFRRLAVEHPVAAEMISYYMPFTGVPTNVIKRGVEYSPINAVATVGVALWRGFRGKTFNQKKFVEGVCRPLTAAGVYMLGSMLYNAGKIKMGTGDDEDEGTKYYDARTALGDQYSAYLVDDISGTNASLSSLGPVGTMLLFGAAMSSELDKQGEDGKRLMVAVWNALNHNFDSIVDASYFNGITDFFNPNLDESFFETGIRLFGENVAGQMVPAPVAQFAEYLDPYVRDTKDKNKIIEIYKSVANKIPYLRETLPKKVYVTGVVAETRRPPVTKFVDPFTRSHQYEEPELEEAKRLYEFAKNSGDEKISADKNKVLPEDVLRGKKNSFKYKSVEYELNDEQKEAYKLKYGEIWKAKVAARMNDRGWAAYDDETKFKLIKSDMSKAKTETMEWAIENLID